MRRGIIGGLAMLLMLPVLAAAEAAPRPRRIVSLNLCADQLVMALAPPEHIASITWLSRSEVIRT